MKKTGLLLGVLFASMGCVSAQVKVEVALEQDQFLPGEALPAAVRITNRSGQTLRLGGDVGWLTFAVQSRDGFIVVKTGEVPVAGEFTLESSKRAIKQVDLSPYFNLKKTGRYSIIATVRIKEWNQVITSEPKPFDIITGAKLWEQEVGVPKTGATDTAPEVRKYTLQEANYLSTQLRLYFQLTDGSGKVYKVFPIGPMISFSQPEPQVDRLSNLHVLYQNGPHSFSYTVINSEGDVITRQRYDFTTRPRLKADADGNITVTGGVRRVTSDDVPAPKPEDNDAKTPKP
jgi:hypothetical protein